MAARPPPSLVPKPPGRDDKESTSNSRTARQLPLLASGKKSSSGGLNGTGGALMISTPVSPRSPEMMMASLNLQVSASRERFVQQQDERVRKLQQRDERRKELLQRQHASRWVEMSEQLDEVAVQDQHTYEIKQNLRESFSARSQAVHEEERLKRAHFLSGRDLCLRSQEAALTELRQDVFLTPSPNHSPRNVSPEKMSTQVQLRLMPSPRRPDDPLQSKEALVKMQAKRDDQVEQQRLLQEQQLAERRRRREEQTAALRARLEDIVRRTREENDRSVRKKETIEARIKSWRWRKHHGLRAEAIARLESAEGEEHYNDDETQQRPADERTSKSFADEDAAIATSTQPIAAGDETKEEPEHQHDPPLTAHKTADEGDERQKREPQSTEDGEPPVSLSELS